MDKDNTMLQEARIDKLDAMKAAVEYPLSFKQTLVKVLKSKGFKVDREKTFKKPSVGNGDGLLLYGRSGDANQGSGFRRESKSIHVYLHGGERITLTPDTMGNVRVEVGNSRNVVGISGKSSIEFFNDVASSLRNLEGGNETKGFKEFIDGMSSSLGHTFEIESRGYYSDDSRRVIKTVLSSKLPEGVKSEIDNKTRINNTLSEVFDEPSIKSAYKKATGESAGAKGDIYTISSSFLERRRHIYDVAQIYYSVDKIKELALSVRDYLKGSDFVITNIRDGVSYKGLEVDIALRTKESLYSERSNKSVFDIYKYIKELKKRNSYKEALDYNHDLIQRHVLPIAKKVIKRVL